ncbi:MAG: ABC transporter permease [Candidatus Melainabacteria bacterium]|nr:ABC transporter permease [Candidatus Melainabacteria bacterium]
MFHMAQPVMTDVYLSHGFRDPLSVRASRELNSLWRYKDCVPTFVINNLRRRYQRSVLGFFWSLLNPLLMMTIMTVVFSVFFNKEPRDFALYVFSGLLPWSFMSATMTSGCGSIVEAESYLKKLPVPKLIFPLVHVATEATNFVLSLLALAILGAALGLPFQLSSLLLPLAVVPIVAFTLGITMLLAVSTVYFRDIAHIVAVSLGGIFYLTPILYPVSAVPERFREWYQFNPFFQQFNLLRALVCDGRLPSVQEWSIAIALSVVALSVGTFVYLWRERDIVYRL